MPHHATIRIMLGLAGSTLLATTAWAWDPNEGADSGLGYQPPARYSRLPENIVPRRYYTSGAVAAAPVANQPAFIAAPAYAPAANTIAIAPLPPSTPMAAASPAYAPAPVYSAASPPPMTAPAYPTAPATPAAPYVVRTPDGYEPTPSTPYRANRFSVGIEGYYDEYQEDSVGLTDKGMFASLTASYDHYFNPQWYGAIEARGSYGSTDYESVSGTIDDIPQWEIETRILTGYDAGRSRVYTGLGTRYFVDELKGKTSSLGAAGYDRRILQFYLPIGVSYEFAAYGLQFTPNLEYDQLIYGYVNSRLQTIPTYYELDNNQTTGYGLRGELLMGQVDENGRGWQFGPFFRYWDIADSKIDRNPRGTWLEPENTRLQAGANLKYLF